MAFLQKKTGTPTHLQSLQELSQILSDLQARTQESQRLQKAAADELVTWLAAQRKSETERPRFVQARQSAQFAEQEAKNHLARYIGKPEESTALSALREVQETVQETVQALAACDKAFDREAAHTRILALREQLQSEEQHERSLRDAYEKAKHEQRTAVLTGLYTGLQQILDILEYGGSALEILRNEAPEAYEQVLQDACISQYDFAELLIQRFTVAGITEENYRPELKARQQSIKETLAQKECLPSRAGNALMSIAEIDALVRSTTRSPYFR